MYNRIKEIRLEKLAGSVSGLSAIPISLLQEFLKPVIGTMGIKAKMALQKAHYEMMNSNYKEVYQRVVMQDPLLKAFENKELLSEAFKVMIRYSPNLAAEPLVVKGYLRNIAHGDGVLSEQTLKSLLEAENKYVESK